MQARLLPWKYGDWENFRCLEHFHRQNQNLLLFQVTLKSTIQRNIIIEGLSFGWYLVYRFPKVFLIFHWWNQFDQKNIIKFFFLFLQQILYTLLARQKALRSSGASSERRYFFKSLRTFHLPTLHSQSNHSSNSPPPPPPPPLNFF